MLEHLNVDSLPYRECKEVTHQPVIFRHTEGVGGWGGSCTFFLRYFSRFLCRFGQWHTVSLLVLGMASMFLYLSVFAGLGSIRKRNKVTLTVC